MYKCIIGSLFGFLFLLNRICVIRIICCRLNNYCILVANTFPPCIHICGHKYTNKYRIYIHNATCSFFCNTVPRYATALSYQYLKRWTYKDLIEILKLVSNIVCISLNENLKIIREIEFYSVRRGTAAEWAFLCELSCSTN